MDQHNVGLIRWIFEIARDRHLARPSYQARHECPSTSVKYYPAADSKGMVSVIFREVLNDVMLATRDSCRAYRALELGSAAACRKAEVRNRMQKVKRKLFAVGIINKMLREMREEGDKAELLWRECWLGLASTSINSKAFASRSLGLASFNPCGSISRGLRRYRRESTDTQHRDLNHVSQKQLDKASPPQRLPALTHAPTLKFL
jgi:hypothetical protein